MKVQSISALSPTVTPWKNGQYLHSASWTATDSVAFDGTAVRVVKHYNTAMVEFVDQIDGEWWLGALSAGHGSNSDMGGFRKLAETVGSPLRIRRDAKGGGPRVVNIVHGNKVHTPN